MPSSSNLLLPVLPLRDVSLFPEASLERSVKRGYNVRALELATRTGGRLLAVGRRDPLALNPGARDLHEIGTVAALTEDMPIDGGGRRVELDGLQRGRIVSIVGTDTAVAEIELLEEGDPGDEWGTAVEALARYLHAHAELRAFLDQRRRSHEPMAWVNLACQHLPISATARQRLLEANAADRCVKIGRGLDALLRKEQSV
jgi:ATP-dependent Lon protease